MRTFRRSEQERLSHLSYEWTRKNVAPETKRILGALPFRMDVLPDGGHVSGAPRLVLVHATPTINTLYWTEDRSDAFWESGSSIRAASGGRRTETGGPVTSC